MNFYTKVLWKFAATDGIALTGRSASLPKRADVLLTRVAQADVTARRIAATCQPSMIYCESDAALHRYSPHAQSAVKLLAEPQNSQPQRQG
jgi:hypothetical protein